MKTAIVYASPTPQRDTHEIGIYDKGNIYKLHIRVKLTNKPPEEALATARPRKCETLLNAIEISQ